MSDSKSDISKADLEAHVLRLGNALLVVSNFRHVCGIPDEVWDKVDFAIKRLTNDGVQPEGYQLGLDVLHACEFGRTTNK